MHEEMRLREVVMTITRAMDTVVEAKMDQRCAGLMGLAGTGMTVGGEGCHGSWDWCLWLPF